MVHGARGLWGLARWRRGAGVEIQVDKFLALTAMLAGFVPAYGPAAGDDVKTDTADAVDGPTRE